MTLARIRLFGRARFPALGVGCMYLPRAMIDWFVAQLTFVVIGQGIYFAPDFMPLK